MIIQLIALFLTAITAAYSDVSFQKFNYLLISSGGETSMISTSPITISVLRLLAREERVPPLGIPPQPNRDIGFASVFIRLENSQETTGKLSIKKIEIRNVSDGKLQAFTFSPQQIELKPLENSEIAFHLSNKTGYVGQDKVKAFVTYQIEDQVKVIESEAVAVNKT